MNRIKFLDGIRGLAILLVILFHAYARWPEIVPYSNEFLLFPIMKYWWLGVQLFFLLSGFVILMTLEKTKDAKDFVIKRWLRLFPAMLIATILVYSTTFIFVERPSGIPRFLDIFSGLFFFAPDWSNRFFAINPGLLEGSFWSLFVEVKFYIVFGFLYFTYGKTNGLFKLFILYIISIFISKLYVLTGFPIFIILNNFFTFFSFDQFGWFISGALLYMYFEKKERKYIMPALIIGIISALLLMIARGNNLYDFIFAIIILIVFVLPMICEKIQNIFENKLLIFMGFISYPLYLIHENMMISMIIKMDRHFKFIPDLLLPILPIIIISLMAYIIAKFIEPKLRNLLKKLIVKLKIGK